MSKEPIECFMCFHKNPIYDFCDHDIDYPFCPGVDDYEEELKELDGFIKADGGGGKRE